MTDDFFNATTQLETIRQWARARYAAPWAVFGAVLLRAVVSTGPGVQLPGVIGGPASLNMIAAFVSASGGGKGISDKVARLVWPTPLIERPIGSGEGIAALFAAPKKDADQRITQAIINVSEIDSLTGIASRQGSILLAQLKAAVMGELIGQSNAQEATSRVVQPHTYRLGMSIGAQPGHCDVIFNDATGGTPQRILWFPTTDPDMPADPGTDPEPLNTRLPAWAHTDTEITYGPPEIREAIISAHLARQRGETSAALDGHRMLTRCKVAAGLAILHHRSVVSDLDWELSESVMAVSDQTREWVISEAKKAARAKVRDRAISRAVGEDFYDSSRLETVRRSIVRMLESDGEQSGGDLRRRLGKREKRELFDQAIALLESDGMVDSKPGEHGSKKYRIGSPVTTLVTPENASSDGVTSPVTRDRLSDVTVLDSRRSRCSHCQADPPRSDTGLCDGCTHATMTAGEFLVCWIRANAGPGGWVTPGDAINAGAAIGYTRAALKAARDRHTIPRMEASGQGRGSRWRITPSDTTANTAEESPA